jgi:hypothetical protein
MTPVTDMIIQLFICYICVTLIELEDLNRIDCYLIKDSIGSYELKVLLKEDMPEAVGVLHAVDDASSQISLIVEVSVD